MNGYLRPPVFWALMSFACLLWLTCAFAGGRWAPYVLFVLGVAIVATLVEWAIEQQWPEQVRIIVLHWRLTWHSAGLLRIRAEIADAGAYGDIDEMQALQHLYYDEHRKWRRIREQIVAAYATLDGSIEGVDYTL
jgi:hypothetical protein